MNHIKNGYMKNETLKYGQFYHIYNRGIDSCNIFRELDNYEHFLSLYDKYISPIANTYAWVLMPNHFHLLVKMMDRPVSDLPGSGNLAGLHQPFSNFFNAYAKAFNKRFGRHGTLFEQPFKRKCIHNRFYFKRIILYIHNNPVHHGFCSHPVEYPWSSYLTCISIKPTKLQRDLVMGWFDSHASFRQLHFEKVDVEGIDKWLGI
jgi:REP element-mobilizing transposase RayT